MPESAFLRTRIYLAGLSFLAVIALGTLGYMLLLDWSMIDALYMAIITISTVGFGEIHELDETGRLFTLILILFGVGSFTYLFSTLHNYFIAGHLFGRLERRSMEKRVAKLDQHVIVCGFGRVGLEVVTALIRENVPVVVVDRDPAPLERAAALGAAIWLGDAEDDGALTHVGVERARSLVTVVDDDASNLMITLTARGLNADLYIVARINRQASEKKLIQAGADRILWPYGLAGRRLAQMALRPGVVEFLDVVQRGDTLELKLEETKVSPDSPLAGQTIKAAEVRARTGTTVVAIRHVDGQLELVTPETPIGANDVLLALGATRQLDALRELARE